MASTFIATVTQKRGSFIIDSTVSVYQQTAGNSYAPVAYLYDTADPADHRKTKIRYADGVLHFGAAYDGPVRDHVVWTFMDENYRDIDVSLHCFPFAGQAGLCSSKGFFPIETQWESKAFKIIIGTSSPVLQKEGLLYSVLATLTQTQKKENGFVYTIQLEENVPGSLLMAIFSLPFTLLDIN